MDNLLNDLFVLLLLFLLLEVCFCLQIEIYVFLVIIALYIGYYSNDKNNKKNLKIFNILFGF